jgi:hypothetical protein
MVVTMVMMMMMMMMMIMIDDDHDDDYGGDDDVQYISDLFFLPGPCHLWNYLTPTGWRFLRQARVLADYGEGVIRETLEKKQAGA